MLAAGLGVGIVFVTVYDGIENPGTEPRFQIQAAFNSTANIEQIAVLKNPGRHALFMQAPSSRFMVTVTSSG